MAGRIRTLLRKLRKVRGTKPGTFLGLNWRSGKDSRQGNEVRGVTSTSSRRTTLDNPRNSNNATGTRTFLLGDEKTAESLAAQRGKLGVIGKAPILPDLRRGERRKARN